jgi:hypothetical protein
MRSLAKVEGYNVVLRIETPWSRTGSKPMFWQKRVSHIFRVDVSKWGNFYILSSAHKVGIQRHWRVYSLWDQTLSALADVTFRPSAIWPGKSTGFFARQIWPGTKNIWYTYSSPWMLYGRESRLPATEYLYFLLERNKLPFCWCWRHVDL